MKKMAGMAALLLFGLLIANQGLCQEKLPPPPPTIHSGFSIPQRWLKKKTTVEEAEKANLVTDQRLGPKPVPFGFINDRWLDLKANMRPGDELWEFESSPASWQDLAGRAGFCIVREGRVIDGIITRMN